MSLASFLAQMKMEWRLQMARPFVWFCAFGFFALAFGATLENAFGTSGYTWVNGASEIGTRALILSILGIIIAAGVIGDAMSRDHATNTEEVVLVTGMNRITSGPARFLVAFLLVLVISAMFIPGVILATFFPGIPDERLGPLVLLHFFKAMGIYMIPNLLLVSALIYAISARWRSQTTAFVVALGLIALYVTALMMLGKDVYRHDVFQQYALMDPYGNIAGAENAMTQTVAQSNTNFRAFDGLLLKNRVIWLLVSITLFIVGTLGIPKFLRQPKQKIKRQKNIFQSLFPKIFSNNVNNQFWLMTSWELKTLWRQPGVLLLLSFAAFSLWWTAASSVTHAFSLPTTDLLVHNANFYFDKILIVFLVWFAADIVWREQQHHVDEVIDTMPTNDGWRFLSKTFALLIIVIVFWLLSIVVNIAYQLANEFHDLEIGLYLKDTFLFKAPYYLWMAVLAMAMQVIIRKRFIAIGLVLFIYLSGTFLDAMGFYHPIYRFAEVSFFWYSNMDGYGHFWRGHVWFLLYWTIACVVLWVIAWGCYTRGTNPPTRRYLWNHRLFSRKGFIPFAAAIIAFIAVGFTIVYQSMLQHRWPLFNENKHMAWIEKNYRAEWGKIGQPRITGIQGKIDIYPEQRRVEMQGQVKLENQSSDDIQQLLVFFHPHLTKTDLNLQDVAIQEQDESIPHIQVWTLNQALVPGASIQLPFHTESYPDEGFAAHAQHDDVPEVHSLEVLGNGTSLLNLNLIPAPGYSERLEHKPEWRRKKYGLEPQWKLPESNVGAHVPHETTHLSWVKSIDVTVSTSEDQIPLHSGASIKDLGIIDGRRVIQYQDDNPTRGWSEVLSGRYQVFQKQKAGLPDIELYYHPLHDYTLHEMADALHHAIGYYQSRYGSAPFNKYRLAESSLHYNKMGSRAGLAFMTEVLGWKTDLSKSKGEDIRKLSGLLMGIEWWAGQIIPGNVPGAKVVLSGLPYWSTSLYLHHARGIETSRKLRLQDMREVYRARSKLQDEELPFMQEMKDSSMIRTKGALAIIYLAELVGQDKLEKALANLLNEWRYRPAPYPTAKEFLEHLKRELPAHSHTYLDDLFLTITNWRLQTKEAKTWITDNGKWILQAKVNVSKWHTKGLGEEIQGEMNTQIPITVFRNEKYTADSIIHQKWISLESGENEITLTLDEKPSKFGIDAYLYLPDANPYDNVIDIEEISMH